MSSLEQLDGIRFDKQIDLSKYMRLFYDSLKLLVFLTYSDNNLILGKNKRHKNGDCRSKVFTKF